jgi:hypothetical protein
MSVMTHACPTWEYALPRPHNRVLRAIRNFTRRTVVREMHVTFIINFVYDYVTILCMTQVEVILNHRNPILCGNGQEAMHRKYNRHKLCGGQAYERQAD